MRITHDIEIECTPQNLWPFLEEPEKQKLWLKGMLENEATSEGPTRVGSTFRMKIKEGPKIAEYDGEITKWELHRHMGLKMSGGSFGDSPMQIDYRLSDLGGRTRLDYEANWTPPNTFMKVVGPVFAIFGKMQVKGFFKTLRREAETVGGGGGI